MNVANEPLNSKITLGELLPELKMLPADVRALKVSGVNIDSREISEGDIFIALRGGRVDGQQFMSSAIEKGAVAVLIESTLGQRAGALEKINGRPVIAVGHLAERVSALAGHCYGEPSTHMNVIGVTGTNGKSTCVSLIAQIETLLGSSAASLGTLGVSLDGNSLGDFGMTTPDACLCQKLLAQLRAKGVSTVAMEVSSHGLDQNRVSGIKFKSAIFTNIGHDHLDYHESIENYVASKLKLFQSIGLQTAVVNLDDPFSGKVLSAARNHARVLSYSLLHFAADIYVKELNYTAHGVQFRLSTPWGESEISSPLIGEFNVYNLISAIACLCDAGRNFEDVVRVIPKLHSVDGRMEKINFASDITVIIDYAHTPDALGQAIAATRAHTAGKLWVVFGCGGDRDRSKRPVMARTVEKYADVAVVTSDNPRTENVELIINDVLKGFEGTAPLHFVERESAIEYAIATAEPTDVILLAGKGHENYQIIGEEKLPFNERFIAESALKARNQKRQWSDSP